MFNTPYGIYKYEINTLCAYISYQTNTPLHHVKQKPQISYLSSYLDYFDKIPLFFIHENEYIDKYYLEDYSEYYVRCFQNYTKNCSRIHFFKLDKKINKNINIEADKEIEVKRDKERDKLINKYIKEEFHLALKGKKSTINKKNYLGYIVIRPIPQTFFSKVCLKPYYLDKKKDRLKHFIITRKYTVYLFGIKLIVNTVAQQEQDKILAACATSALWSFFHAHPNLSIKHLPSASSITKNAYSEENGHDREFPNSGLSTDMICRSLKANGLSPKYYQFLKDDDEDKKLDKKIALLSLKEHIFAYCSSNLPIILGVSIKDAKDNTDKGLHAVTVLGYSLKKSDVIDSSSFKLVSHSLEKLYVHDDRLGAFARIDFEHNGIWNVSIFNDKSVTEVKTFEPEIYTPDTLIIGVYHKVRIPYLTIKNTCKNLFELLIKFLLDKGETQKPLVSVIENFLWDIQIKKVSELKSWILSKDCKIQDKEKYLTTSWPKYIWSAKASLEGEDIFELLFDATDIEQGNLFLDILPLNDEFANGFIDILTTFCNVRFNSRVTQEIFSEKTDNQIWGIIEYFSKKNNYLDSLNNLFGHIKIPIRLKKDEIDGDAIIEKYDVRFDKEEPKFQLVKDLKNQDYIWVIDSDGFLCIGREKIGSNQGHPTLTDGKPARIGGQLKYNSDEVWEVDPFSGRYSSDYTEDEKVRLVNNAIKHRFNVFIENEKFIITKEFSNEN